MTTSNHFLRLGLASFLATVALSSALAEDRSGKEVVERTCASCHEDGASSLIR